MDFILGLMRTAAMDFRLPAFPWMQQPVISDEHNLGWASWPGSWTVPVDSTDEPSVGWAKRYFGAEKWSKEPVVETIERHNVEPTPVVTQVAEVFLESKVSVPVRDSMDIAAIDLPDPRLLPHSVFGLRCKPGEAFHFCVQSCLASAPTTEGKSYKEAQRYTTCVEDCRDAYLSGTGDGCLTLDGAVLPHHHSESNTTEFNARSFRWKAWWHRIKRQIGLKTFSVGRIWRSVFLDVFSIWMVVGLGYWLKNSGGHVAAFVLFNGGENIDMCLPKSRGDKDPLLGYESLPLIVLASEVHEAAVTIWSKAQLSAGEAVQTIRNLWF